MGSIQKGEVDVQSLIQNLTVDEKISLLAGENFWETVPIPRLNIPSLKTSDGPNGARGNALMGGTKSACFPASVCLAASWDTSLVRKIGGALAGEARSKGADVMLAPTVCPHRSPLGGRNFESFSEDPLLAGKLAAQYITGLQENGVGATIKHFAVNEQETKRFSMNVNLDQRTLREIYLKPFEIAIKEAKPWAVMTAYNLVNGVHCDASDFLLQTVLREQWGWKGLVMSDWGGTNSTAESLNAGLDLEMPGPTYHRKIEAVKAAIKSGKVSEETINKRAEAVLNLLVQTKKFDHPKTPEEQAIDRPEDRALIRQAGASGMVLLKNEGNVLPLKKEKLKKVAVLGLGKECLAHGGGSASVNSHYKRTPWQALETAFDGKVEMVFEQGASIIRNIPDLAQNVFDKEGKPGFTVSTFNSTDMTTTPASTANSPSACYQSITERFSAVNLEGTYKPQVSGPQYISFSSIGKAKAYINDKLIFDITESTEDIMGFMFGFSEQKQVLFDFEEGKEYKLRLETFRSEPNPDLMSLFNDLIGLRFGYMPRAEFEADLLTPAVEAAKSADVALVFVGNTTIWETEGQDMDDMSLPSSGSQDRLVVAVAAANPNTIVINSTGVPVAMPWLNDVPAVLQTWFPGQEAGNSIADVLLGAANPGGRLPVTFPKSLQDCAAYGNFPGDVPSLQVHYKEGIYMGYRHFDTHPEKVLFPFGYGLSYTKFNVSAPTISSNEISPASTITVQVEVENTGNFEGQEVIQVYIAQKQCSVDVPSKQLAGFAKSKLLRSGEKDVLEVKIGKENLAYWSEPKGRWVVESGEYTILVGKSTVDIVGEKAISVAQSFEFGP